MVSRLLFLIILPGVCHKLNMRIVAATIRFIFIYFFVSLASFDSCVVRCGTIKHTTVRYFWVVLSLSSFTIIHVILMFRMYVWFAFIINVFCNIDDG